MLASGTKYECSWAKIGDNKIWESNEGKLLCGRINNKLKFDSHVASKFASKPVKN